MYNFAKRVTSAVVAGAVVLGTLAFYPGWNKGKVNAASLYDSVNLVNYETVLGRAMDYGIVSARYTQNDHLETTLATKSFTHLASQFDVDLTTAKTAQFIIGEVTSNSVEPGTIYFGTVTNGKHQVYVKNMNIILPDGFDTTNKVVKRSDVATTTAFNYTFMNQKDINDSIDKIIDHAKDESDKMVIRTGNSDYVLESRRVSENSDGSLTTINLNSDEFENRVVYVNLDAPEFNSLRSAWGREPGGYHLHINKRSSTVVVFTYQGTADIKIGKVRVEAKDSPLYSSTNDHDSTTDCMGAMTVHNDYVDQEIAQKLIWNIPNALNVTLTGSAGTFLALKENVSVTIEGSPSAGWLVSNGNAENTCEFHYIFGGSSEDIQTEGEGQMHFALHKNFSSDYYTKEELKADPTLIDNSITFNAGAFEFNWQEYSDSSFTTPIGESITRSVDANSIVELPRQTFVTNNVNDPHYVAPGGQPKDFYFRITENPNVKIAGISNNAGYINICLRVTADTDGKISFKVQSVTMSGDDGNNLITYSTNGDASTNKWVDMVGPRFDLGAFYNKVVPVVNKGYITITKTVQITDPDADVSKTSFIVKDESGTVWGRYNLKDHFVYDSSTGFYTLKTTCEVPDASQKYFVEETAATVDGYNSVSYYVDDAGKDNNGNSIAFDSVSNDSDNPTKANFKNVYTKDTTKGSLVVTKVLGDNSPSSASYKPFVFSISGPNNYSKSITIVGAGTVRIDGLEPGNYTVTENTADPDIQINGYTLSVSNENGTSVPVSANSTSSISITNTYNEVNEEKGSIVIIKTIDGPLTQQDIDGLTFKVFNENNLTTPVWTGKLSETTGDSPNFRYEGGKYISKELFVPVGNYIVVEELTTDEGTVTVTYTLNNVAGTVTDDYQNKIVQTDIFSVDKDDVKTLSFLNKYATGTVEITKNISGLTTEQAKNLGAITFKVTGPAAFNNNTGEAIIDYSQFSGGKYVFENVPVGKYTVVETNDGHTSSYSIESTKINGVAGTSTSLDLTSNNTATFAFENTYKNIPSLANIIVSKVNADGELSGAEMMLSGTDATGKNIDFSATQFEAGTNASCSVDASGNLKFITGTASSRIINLADGSYKLEETTPPQGYSKAPVITFVIENGAIKNITGVDTINSFDSSSNKFTVFDEVAQTSQITLKITKTVDSATTTASSFPVHIKGADDKYYGLDGKEITGNAYKTVLIPADGAEVSISGLPVQDYFISEVNPGAYAAQGYSLSLNSTTSYDAKNLKDGDTVNVSLKNIYEKTPVYGSLEITKAKASGSADIGADETFSFVVTFDGDISKATFDPAIGGTLNATDKTWSFNLKVGETAKLTNIPAGTGYSIKETTNAGYRDVSAVTGTIPVAGGTVSKTIENYKNTTNTEGYIDITKTFGGVPDTADKSGLTFKIYEEGKTDAVAEYLFGTDFKEESGVYSLKKLFTAEVGKTYYVEESNTAITDYDLVSIKYSVGSGAETKVTTATAKTGAVTVTQGATTTTAFTNTYKQKTTPVQTGSLVVSKTISGAPLNELETISFTVVDGANNALTDADGKTVTIPDLTTANVTAGLWKDSGDGKTFTYTVGNLAAGTKCTVTETYNETTSSKYTLITTGTNASTTEATVTIEANKEKKAEITNNFEQKTTPVQTGSLVVSKTISGAPLNELETISFTVVDGANNALTDADGKTVTIPDLTTANVTAGLWKDSGDGKTFTYTVGNLAAGTKCTVTETYNETTSSKYTLITTGTNASTTEATVTIEANKEKKAEITNNFEQKTTPVQTGSLVVSKTISGAPLNELETISFTVVDGANNALTDADGKTVTIPDLTTANVTAGLWKDSGDGKTFTYTVGNLAAGTKCTVTETYNETTSSKYTLITTGTNASTTEATVTIEANKEKKAEITNNFEQKTTPVQTGSLVVSKTISGAPLNELETISFTVVDGANNALTDADGKTVTIPDLTTANVTAGLWKDSGDGKTFTYTVGNLAAGTKCTVTETYNETTSSKYTLITTGTNASTTEATVTIEANKEKKAEITNNFEQKTPATGTIEITKNIQGVTDTTVVGKLTFEISSDAGYSATVTYPDDFSGNTWSDTVPVGTYTVKETNKGGTSEYLIDTYSVNNKGIGSDEDSLQLATNGTISFEFTNVYKDNSTAAEKTLVINKVIDGITVSQASSFGDDITFVITQTSGTGFNGDQPLTVYYSQFTNGTYLISGVPDGEYKVEETTFGGTSTYPYVATTTNGTQGATSATVDFANITDNKAEFTFVNEYKDNSAGPQTPGSLVIYKTVDGNIPSGADSATYYFDVTGPSYPNGTTVSVVAGSSAPLDNLIPGDYTVSEDRSSANYPDYTLNVSGESIVGVSAGSASDCTITNSYTKNGVTPGPGPGPGPVPPSTGYISFSKTFGGDVTEAEAAGCGLYFVITNEAGEYLDLDGNISSDEVRITLKDMDHTDGTLVWSKTINDVPFGTYYVTEHNEVIYINGGKVPYTFDKTTSLTTDHTSLEKASPDGTFVLENYYTHPGFDVTISKEDIAGKEIAQAQLKFKSLDGYDLSKVVVTQNGVPVQFTLSENNTAITFTTIEGYPSIIQGLFSGRYELEETVTPEAYLTAEKIIFVLNNDGTITDGEGKISAYGSPVVMIDQADPYYDTEVISANRTPSSLPATGEKTSIFAIAGTMLLGLFAAIVAGIGVYRKKKDGI